ncbi:tRNA (guanosine(46)-N7)-methyltransferase TrmB [Demetria terragena]|uniref:tRNA (guanosine(46)-N7)-methyltransferase TrmB n=1 Tax=Demetria terragena TaxID=63959 RepID=UPI000684BAB4|nr:tRNA (guanosine(46)-N7)-methyltransferase TrmB [Demetria terragena]
MPSRHQRALDRHAETFVLDVPREGDGGSVVADSRLDLGAAFGRQAPVVLEIGSGAGDCVVAAARQHPELDFLAMEVWRPGLAQTISKAVHAGVENIRLVEADAAQALPLLIGPDELSEVWIFFPDPWPKKKHHKRRLVTPEFAQVVANVLEPQGVLRLATDWEEYAWQMLEVVNGSDQFANLYGAGDGFAPRFEGRVETRFERRGNRADRPVRDLAAQLTLK